MAGIDEVQVRADDDYEFEGDIADEGNELAGVAAVAMLLLFL